MFGRTSSTLDPLHRATVDRRDGRLGRAALGYALPALYLRLLRVKNGGCPRASATRPAALIGRTTMSALSSSSASGPWGIDSDRVRHAAHDRAGRTAPDRARRWHGCRQRGTTRSCSTTASVGRVVSRASSTCSRGRLVRRFGDEFRGVLRGLVDCPPDDQRG